MKMVLFVITIYYILYCLIISIDISKCVVFSKKIIYLSLYFLYDP